MRLIRLTSSYYFRRRFRVIVGDLKNSQPSDLEFESLRGMVERIVGLLRCWCDGFKAKGSHCKQKKLERSWTYFPKNYVLKMTCTFNN